MITFSTLALIGFIIIIAGVLIAINTSIGGTRSDYNDGSGFIASAGLFILVVGIIGMIVNFI